LAASAAGGAAEAETRAAAAEARLQSTERGGGGGGGSGAAGGDAKPPSPAKGGGGGGGGGGGAAVPALPSASDPRDEQLRALEVAEREALQGLRLVRQRLLQVACRTLTHHHRHCRHHRHHHRNLVRKLAPTAARAASFSLLRMALYSPPSIVTVTVHHQPSSPSPYRVLLVIAADGRPVAVCVFCGGGGAAGRL